MMNRLESLAGLAVVGASRLATVAAVAAAGVAGIAGCGVGPCANSSTGCPPPPPPDLFVDLERYRFTVAVGDSASLLAIVTDNSGGQVAYALQWCRRPKDSPTCTPIAGATTDRYVLPPVNLSNDGDSYTVTLSYAYVSRTATASLTVSSGEAAQVADGDFVPSDWSVATALSPDGFATATADRQPSGGNPDAYRRITYQPAGSGGQIEMFHLRLGAVHDPAAQGAIKAIDFELDCTNLTSSAFYYYMTTQPIIEQSGRHFKAAWFDSTIECNSGRWTPVRAYSLAWYDFYQHDGPACTEGDKCPDFTATGAPIRLGFITEVNVPDGAPSDPVVQGIDNWKVTVWRP